MGRTARHGHEHTGARHGGAQHGGARRHCRAVLCSAAVPKSGPGTALRGLHRVVSCRPTVPTPARRRPCVREAGIGRDGEESSRKLPAALLRLREAGAGRRGGELEKASGRRAAADEAARAPPWARPLLASPAAGRPSTVGAAVARRQKEEERSELAGLRESERHAREGVGALGDGGSLRRREESERKV